MRTLSILVSASLIAAGASGCQSNEQPLSEPAIELIDYLDDGLPIGIHIEDAVSVLDAQFLTYKMHVPDRCEIYAAENANPDESAGGLCIFGQDPVGPPVGQVQTFISYRLFFSEGERLVDRSIRIMDIDPNHGQIMRRWPQK